MAKSIFDRNPLTEMFSSVEEAMRCANSTELNNMLRNSFKGITTDPILGKKNKSKESMSIAIIVGDDSNNLNNINTLENGGKMKKFKYTGRYADGGKKLKPIPADNKGLQALAKKNPKLVMDMGFDPNSIAGKTKGKKKGPKVPKNQDVERSDNFFPTKDEVKDALYSTLIESGNPVANTLYQGYKAAQNVELPTEDELKDAFKKSFTYLPSAVVEAANPVVAPLYKGFQAAKKVVGLEDGGTPNLGGYPDIPYLMGYKDGSKVPVLKNQNFLGFGNSSYDINQAMYPTGTDIENRGGGSPEDAGFYYSLLQQNLDAEKRRREAQAAEEARIRAEVIAEQGAEAAARAEAERSMAEDPQPRVTVDDSDYPEFDLDYVKSLGDPEIKNTMRDKYNVGVYEEAPTTYTPAANAMGIFTDEGMANYMASIGQTSTGGTRTRSTRDVSNYPYKVFENYGLDIADFQTGRFSDRSAASNIALRDRLKEHIAAGGTPETFSIEAKTLETPEIRSTVLPTVEMPTTPLERIPELQVPDATKGFNLADVMSQKQFDKMMELEEKVESGENLSRRQQRRLANLQSLYNTGERGNRPGSQAAAPANQQAAQSSGAFTGRQQRKLDRLQNRQQRAQDRADFRGQVRDLRGQIRDLRRGADGMLFNPMFYGGGMQQNIPNGGQMPPVANFAQDGKMVNPPSTANASGSMNDTINQLRLDVASGKISAQDAANMMASMFAAGNK